MVERPTILFDNEKWKLINIINEIKSIEDNGQIAVTYCDNKGNDDEHNNPNGAIKNIAGIFNKDKNILGMMPHPERMIDPFLSGEDGSLFFENLIGSM